MEENYIHIIIGSLIFIIILLIVILIVMISYVSYSDDSDNSCDNTNIIDTLTENIETITSNLDLSNLGKSIVLYKTFQIESDSKLNINLPKSSKNGSMLIFKNISNSDHTLINSDKKNINLSQDSVIYLLMKNKKWKVSKTDDICYDE
jgi:hypothetical protein